MTRPSQNRSDPGRSLLKTPQNPALKTPTETQRQTFCRPNRQVAQAVFGVARWRPDGVLIIGMSEHVKDGTSNLSVGERPVLCYIIPSTRLKFLLHCLRGIMRCIVNLFLICFQAVFLAPGSATAQTFSAVPIAVPKLLKVEFHAGETVRYTFSQKMNLATRVDPSVPNDRFASLKPRQYEVRGEIVATFASTPAREPLRGSVQFQGLTIKDWVSAESVADLESRLHQLEAAPATLTTAADGNLELADIPAQLRQDRYVLDVEDLHSVAQAVLISRITTEPLAVGQERESTDFPVPGLVKPGLNMTVITEYLADVPIAHHPNAEVRLSMHVPNQSHPVPSGSDTSATFERLYAAGNWTYLLDLDGRQISFLHKAVRTETGYSVESADSNEEIRIPKNLFTVEKQYEVTARRVAASAPPEREADLTAFEKSLAAPRRAAANGSAAPAAPSGDVSLGDVARRLRRENQAPPQDQAEPDSPDKK